ncbi:phage tail sheath C-terminal domain-containing protein [Nitrosomonas sp.]|uniref:phage tail sheath C-terminal domain-containing protein n=1 Tax=Nitrosomonas sp. TaxID=42353 RepID=UPI003305BC40
MDTLTTPGIYLEPLQPIRVTGELLRSDIAGFIGYATRGPVGLPVRVESWQQFLAIFGQPLDNGHLALSIKAFFENGGATCYIYRLVDGKVATSSRQLLNRQGDPAWTVYAAFRLSDIVARESEDNRPDPAIVQNLEPGEVARPWPNPGAWGNSLSLTLTRSSRLSTTLSHDDMFNDGFSVYLHNLVGLEEHSVVELTQEGAGVTHIVAIEAIDRFRQSVTWRHTLSGLFDPALPVRLDTVEFDVMVEHEGRQVEKFSWLGVHPQHSRSLYRALAEQSQYLNIEPLPETEIDWYDSQQWPASVMQMPLAGGLDGVSAIASRHYLRALQDLARIEDIGIVAAPDLVLGSRQNQVPVSQVIPKPHDCRSLQAPGKRLIFGQVSDGGKPVAGVAITDIGSGQRVISDSDGLFRIDNLDIGLCTLRFEKGGYSKEERQVFSSRALPSEPVQFDIKPLALPRTLGEDEILSVQQAMANPFVLGPYRIALLDPPAASLRVDQIRSWRSQVGDSAICALFYPWLEAPALSSTDSRLFPLPPCGHVAGLLAHMDRQQGPHCAPANIRLRFAKRVLDGMNNVEHGILNAEGINAIRSLPGQGIRIMGARTLGSDADWRYLSVRRLVFALERTLERSLQWAVFENNDTVLRQALMMSVATLLNSLWRRGALSGRNPEAAYRVKCDSDNNPSAQRDQGRLLVEIAIAPSVPFEFIRIRFGKTLDAIEVTES